MVNVQVNTREEFFKAAGEREAMIRELDNLVQKAAPKLKPVLFGGMTGKWLGYGMMPYQTKSMKESSQWPVIAIANQKNYISLYVMYLEDREYVAEKYKDTLGKVSVGKSCIRFKKLEDLNIDGVNDLIKRVARKVEKDGWAFSV
jgi:hypothetical protein